MRLGLLLTFVSIVACGGRSTPSNDVGADPDSGPQPDSKVADAPRADSTPPDPDGPAPLPDGLLPDTPPPIPDGNPPPPDLVGFDGVPPPPKCTKLGTATAGTSGPKGKADVLFVVDDSIGMNLYQLALNQAMATLESTLGSSADYRVGVVTTNLGTPFSLPNCIGCGDDGKLQSQPFLSSCLAPMSKYLENNKGVKSYTGTLSNAFKCLSSVGTNGCGFEQPLESAAIFTNPQSFTRADASLVLVVLSNEDDCSAKNTYLYDPSATATAALGMVSSFRCFQHGITCDINDPKVPGPRKGCKPTTGGLLRDVSTYATLFKGLKPAGRVGLVVIAGPTTPVTVSVTVGQASLEPSCQTAQGFASPGIRLKALVDAFGAAGKYHSICGSFGLAMTDVATMVKTL